MRERDDTTRNILIIRDEVSILPISSRLLISLTRKKIEIMNDMRAKSWVNRPIKIKKPEAISNKPIIRVNNFFDESNSVYFLYFFIFVNPK